MTLPKQHRPELKGPEDFVGPARKIAEIAQRIAAKYAPVKEPAFMLMYGPPGSGKSSVAKFAMKAFNVHPMNMVEFSGADFDIDSVRRWSDSIVTSSLFEGYRGLRIEEVDRMPAQAQVRFLKVCDDISDGKMSVRNGLVIACSCNSDINQLEARFQSRFQPFEVRGPKMDEVVPLLSRWLSPEQATQLALGACDNVRNKALDLRSVLNDATTMLVTA